MEDATGSGGGFDWKPPTRLAPAFWRLLTTQHAWVHRRVETIDVLSGEMVKRTMSVDFTIPPSLRRSLADDELGGFLVPVAVLAKERRRNFSLRDEAGRAIPVLGKPMNIEIATSVLRSGIESKDVMAEQRSLSDVAEQGLRAIVEHPGEKTTLAVYEMLSEQIGKAPGELDWLFGDPTLTEMAAELVNRYVLSAVVGNIDNRRILKISFEEKVGPLSKSLGLRSFAMTIPVYGPQSSAGYHVEIIVPEELRIELVALHHRFSSYPCEIERFPMQALVVSSLTSTILAAAMGAEAYSTAESVPAVSLLLSASAIASGFSFIMGEHRLLRAVFIPVRLLLLVTLASVVAAASAVAFDVGEAASAWVGLSATVVSGAVTAMLAVIVIRSAPLRRPTEEA